jgi:hypothetical protein
MTSSAMAQGISTQGPGAGSLGSRLTLQGPGDNASMTTHRDVYKKPCLDFESASRRQVVNPAMFDHLVSVANRCYKPIKLKVCYFKSENCIDVEVAGQQRKDVVLGTSSNGFFRHSYKEKF